MADTVVAPDQGDIGIRIGASIGATRRAIGWSERELARRLGTNQGAIQRLEAGTRPHVDIRLATAALDLLGVRLTIDANPPGLAGRVEQHDAVHARCCGLVARRLRERGWEVRTEVEIGEGRYRGWIDILAYRPSDRGLLVIEVKTELDDVGRVLRSLGWYVRASREAARAAGWRPVRIVPALMALATRETDARVVANVDLIRAALPGGVAALAAWIDEPTVAAPEPSLALIDPLSRRRAWLRRSRASGGRAVAPYADYRAAAEAIRRRSRSVAPAR